MDGPDHGQRFRGGRKLSLLLYFWQTSGAAPKHGQLYRLKGLQPDVAILAENSNYDWWEALKLLRPKTVIIHHYDEWRTPFSNGIPESNRRRAERFAKLIKSVDDKIRIIIPQFFKPIMLD